jgi:hypothetical protein
VPALLAVLAGAEPFVNIPGFGRIKSSLLRLFRPFLDGTASHDHLGDIFAALDAEEFQRCFVAWTASLTGVPEGVVAIDGKTARRSGGKAKAPSIWSLPSSRASASCSARGKSPQIRSDRRDPKAARHVAGRERDHHDRRKGMPTRDLPENHR